MFDKSYYLGKIQQSCTYDEFIHKFLWFLSVADTREKLGLVRMLVCNISCKPLSERNQYEIEMAKKLNIMIDDIQEMIEKTHPY